MRFRQLGSILVLSSLVLVGACASAGSFDQTSEKLVRQGIDASEQLHVQKVLTDPQFQSVNLELHKVAVAGKALTQLLATNAAKQKDVAVFLDAVRLATSTLIGGGYGSAITDILNVLANLETQASKLLGKVPAA